MTSFMYVFKKGEKKRNNFPTCNLLQICNVQPVLIPFRNGWRKMKYIAHTQLATLQCKVLTLSLKQSPNWLCLCITEERVNTTKIPNQQPSCMTITFNCVEHSTLEVHRNLVWKSARRPKAHRVPRHEARGEMRRRMHHRCGAHLLCKFF